ncbi:divergent PAP2 family protein [Candidatus Gracilibacteria bacterium]|nr:divergent PAP2 family protein [Candidatus Gracilibacteria bacterium]NUJ98969.1 divergent PAP2 family protein [Candidatus Gracilibacteria bacterium]
MLEYNQFYTFLISVPTVSFLLAVLLKGISEKVKTGKWNTKRAFGSGGMPSVHSAVVVSLATSVALKYGLESDLFAIVVAFTALIIYDAINVRFEAGLHAEAINEAIGEKKFKESLGHLPSEAFAGSLLGIIVAIALYYV